jgi:toxin FitB
VTGFLLDTNVPSEIIRSQPHPRVNAWFFAQDEATLYLSAITIGELRKGFFTMPAGKRRMELESWMTNDLLPQFEGRILPVTRIVSDRWGVLSGRRKLAGRPLAMADGLIAASVLEHDLTLATRNVKDYEDLAVRIFNPWDP